MLASLALLLAAAIGLSSTPVQETPISAAAPLVPEWVLPGVPVRLDLTAESRRVAAAAPRLGRLRGHFLRATADSLWIQDARSLAATGFGRDALRRVELSLERHHATGRGALIGLIAGPLAGYLLTLAIGQAETDGVLPVWGGLAGPFLGAIVGRCVSVEKWETVWEAGRQP